MNDAQKYLGNEFDKYVPYKGKADTVYGECIRAMNRIAFRNWNDGDMIGYDYGNETCNAPARFLMEHIEDDEIHELILKMWKESEISEKAYENDLDKLTQYVCDYLKENKDKMLVKNEEDMWDYTEPEDYKYDEDDEDDDDYYDDSEDDDDEYEF